MEGPLVYLKFNGLFDGSKDGLLCVILGIYMVPFYSSDSPPFHLFRTIVDLLLVYSLIMEMVYESPVVVILLIQVIHTNMYYSIYHLVLVVNEITSSVRGYKH